MVRERVQFDRPDRREAKAPAKPVYRCVSCGAEACYGAGPPLQQSWEWWCRRCVPAAFFAWPTRAGRERVDAR